jgi:hypothetical protein
MSSVAHEGRLPVLRPPPPTWWAVLVAVLLGALVAPLVLVPAVIAGAEVGLVGHVSGSGVRDWPYPATGLTSLAANAVVWAWILGLTALFIRGFLADRVDRPVSGVAVLAIVGVTGVAAVPRGLLDLPFPLALLAAAALLRLSPVFRLPVLPKRVVVRLFAVGAVALVIPVLHGLTHPLWPGLNGRFERPKVGYATFDVENVGHSKVVLESVALRSQLQLIELVAIRADKYPPSPGGPFESPRLPYTADGKSTTFIQLRVREHGCGTGVIPAEASIRYRVRGAAHDVQVPVSFAVRRCP